MHLTNLPTADRIKFERGDQELSGAMRAVMVDLMADHLRQDQADLSRDDAVALSLIRGRFAPIVIANLMDDAARVAGGSHG